MGKVATLSDVFRFGSVRALVKAALELQPGSVEHLGAKLKKMGFKSSSDWKAFQSGKKELSKAQRGKISRALKFNKNQKEYFDALANLSESKTVRQLRDHAQELLDHKGKIGLKKFLLRDEQISYFTNWYYVAIRELMTTPYFREDPKWIASRLNPKVSVDDVRIALVHLENLGMIKRNDEGKLEAVQNWVSTGDEVRSMLVREFHKSMIEQGKSSMENVVSQLRDISSLTFGVSEENVEKLKQLLSAFRKELLAIAEQNVHPNLIYQLNLQLFPLSKDLSEGGDEE